MPRYQNTDMFTLDCPIAITTNGFVKRSGEAVMGAGAAKQAVEKFPGLQRRTGQLIRANGNIVQIIWDTPTLLSFPVKPIRKMVVCVGQDVVKKWRPKIKPGEMIPGWMATADPLIIRESCRQLSGLADRFGWKEVALNYPGIGNGNLGVPIVQEILDQELDDRFIVCSLGKRR